MSSQRVILFVLDGLRPDGLQQAPTPHVDCLISQGASTYTARTVMPSSTLPCHTSMFRGVTPQRHGITHQHLGAPSKTHTQPRRCAAPSWQTHGLLL